MEDQMNQKIFNAYNPAEAVVRCPRGKAELRSRLDRFSKAAVDLYGVISREELVEIWNREQTDQTDPEELYDLLLPLVLKNAGYGFYKDYLVHDSFFADFEGVDVLLRAQAGKPRFVPPLEEFPGNGNYAWEQNGQSALLEHLLQRIADEDKAVEIFDKIIEEVVVMDNLEGLIELLSRNGLIYEDNDRMQGFMDLIMEAGNTTRMWEHKGHTPLELSEILYAEQEPSEAYVLQPQPKIGRNDPCPCGSGKKFKKCCGRYTEANSAAHLDDAERREFYEIWVGLLVYINDRFKLTGKKIKPVYPYEVPETDIYVLREALWETPELIDEYIASTALPQDRVDILESWRDHFIHGVMVILEHQSDFTVVLADDPEKGEVRYAVRGISGSIANALRRPLPIPVRAVLLPFKGKIIYDTFLELMPPAVGEMLLTTLKIQPDHRKAMGIILTLE